MQRRDQLTDFQLQVTDLYGQGLTQQEIAKKLNRSQQQVSQVLRALPSDIYHDGERAVRLLLQQLHAAVKGKAS